MRTFSFYAMFLRNHRFKISGEENKTGHEKQMKQVLTIEEKYVNSERRATTEKRERDSDK